VTEALADVAAEVVEKAVSRGAIFADVRVDRYVITYFNVVDGVVKEVVTGIESGASVRVLYRGVWGFSSTTDLSTMGMLKALDYALASARALSSGRGTSYVCLLPSREDYVKAVVKLSVLDVPFESKVRDVMELYKVVSGRTYVKSATVAYMDGAGESLYVSSDFRVIRQEHMISWMSVSITGREGDRRASISDEVGSADGYTLWSRWPQEELGSVLLKKLEGQLRGSAPKKGLFTVVLAPPAVGVLVHEAFGHLCEADLAMSGSVVKNLRGEVIAREFITIVDDPTLPGGFGTIKYDDEGVEARPVYLVKNGVLTDFMVNREYASRLGVEPTGNARASSYRAPPLIRMRNTILEPRDYELDELLEHVKFGYYLVSISGGETGIDGTFHVGLQEVYEIVNGEICEPVRNLSISGNSLDVLRNAEAVGKDFELHYGRCSKGQTVFVSYGGPHVRVSNVFVSAG